MQLRTRSIKVFGLLPLTDLSSQDPKYLCMRQCGSVGKEKKSDKQSARWEKKKKHNQNSVLSTATWEFPNKCFFPVLFMQELLCLHLSAVDDMTPSLQHKLWPTRRTSKWSGKWQKQYIHLSENNRFWFVRLGQIILSDDFIVLLNSEYSEPCESSKLTNVALIVLPTQPLQ